MELMSFICPKHPTVWDGKGFSECFEHMVLGFGVNVVSIVMIVVLGLSGRNSRRSTRIAQKHHAEKIFFHLVPAIGAFLPLYDITFLLKRALQGESTLYHAWFFSCSQFSVWTTIMLFSKCDIWFFIFYNRILIVWWIAKPIFEIPHLQTVFSSLQVARVFKESCSFVLDIIFVVYLSIGRVMGESSSKRKCGSLEDSLISCNSELEDDLEDSGDTQSYWHILTFKSINSVMDRGVLKQLDFEDLIRLPIDLNPSTCYSTLKCCWVAEQSKNLSHPSLFRAVCCAYGWPYLLLGLLKVINDCIGFLGPLLLNKLISFLQQGSSNFEGYVFAISLGLISISKSFLDTQYTFRLSKLKLKLRSSIMMSIYQKCLHVSLAERTKFSEGEIQTFMSVDADRTVNLFNSFHDMWSLPLQIGVALYLLYTQVKFAFVSGIAITVLLIPVNRWIATLIARATEKMMKQKDERVRRAGELLTNIRTLKMYGWELLFTNSLMETRSMEVKYLSTRKYLDAWCVFFWATTPTLFSLFTFGVFTLMGNTLDAATVFTCVALFNTLISPLNSLPWVINGLIDALISTRRLNSFLSCSEHSTESVQIAGSSSTLVQIGQPDLTFQHNAVVIRDACCGWSKSDDGQSSVLKQITLNLSKGFFIVVIGEVGSGKSSLLNSILGEMQLTRGSIHSLGSKAYVPQVPWILSGTIRDNILLGKDYHAERYKEVLQACALDIDISHMLGGDLAYVGEKGVNISGGQRARLALARAVYHGPDIFLLDDVLSAVDSQVAEWILYNCIQGPLMDKSTRVICTHNIQAIASADMIVIMDKGHLKWVGSLSEFSVSPYSIIYSTKELEISSPIVRKQSRRSTSAEAEENIQEENGVNFSGEAQESIEIELRKEGKVEPSVYKNYAAFSGWPVAIAICISAVLMQASRNGNDLWLSHWVDDLKRDHDTEPSTSFYLVILCVFCISNSLLTLIRAFSFAFGGLRAAVRVHNKLLDKLVNAPVSFFNQTPIGRILNRLSSDLYTIDDSLPFILNILLANFIGLIGIAIVLTYVQVFFLLLLLPLLYIYSKLQFYYRSTSRELRRLDSVSRSPIYASFTETLDGSSTIRAFKAEEHFMAKFTENVLVYQQTSYSEIIASLWLSLRLQLLAAFVISFVAVMAIIGSHGSFLVSFGTPGLVGLALSYAAPLVSLLSSFLSSFTETEKEMVSVERVLQYMDVPQEELKGCQLIEADWPFQGQIEFQHVTLRYMLYSPAALHDVTFTIAGGTQVGIVGRTGAGKSSIINALFRLSPICGGSILVDGVNVADVAVRDLRSHFGVVPQCPFLFEGTLRDNLDPSRVTSDAKIWHVLEKCHLKGEVEATGGLDSYVKQAGSTFSVGQRQLLCLARAFLKSSKVLCLDECTASIDTQTASILQSAISSECKGMTVITIAHRISTVKNMDNILVLDQGILVEQGNPQDLLSDESSRFSCFAKASTM